MTALAENIASVTKIANVVKIAPVKAVTAKRMKKSATTSITNMKRKMSLTT